MKIKIISVILVCCTLFFSNICIGADLEFKENTGYNEFDSEEGFNRELNDEELEVIFRKDEIAYEEYWSKRKSDFDGVDVELFSTSTYPSDLNSMRERAERIVNYEWTPTVDISTWNNSKYNNSTVFKAGNVVKGMPYTLFSWEWNVDSLLSLSQYKNKVTSNTTKTGICNSVNGTRTGPLYGSCCATFVSEVFGGDFMSGDSPRYDSVTKLQDSTYTTVYTDARVADIKVGDALSIPGHVIWVGEITDTTMTIYEQTPPVAIKKTITKPADNDYLSYKSSNYKTIIRPNSLKNNTEKPVLPKPNITINGTVYPDKSEITSLNVKAGDNITLGWGSSHSAVKDFPYVVKKLDGAPDHNNTSESGTEIVRGTGGKEAITVNLSQGAGWYKFAVGVTSSSDAYSGGDWAWVYVKAEDKGSSIVLERPQLTYPSTAYYYKGDSNKNLPPNQDSIIGTVDYDNPITIKWSKSTNATKYEVAVKVLENSPNPGSNEEGKGMFTTTKTVVGNNQITTDLAPGEAYAGKWVKVYIQAYNDNGEYSSGINYYYFKLKPKTEPITQLGDVNGDNKINYIDAILILRYNPNIGNLTTTQKEKADMNSDGKINYIDAIMVLRYK